VTCADAIRPCAKLVSTRDGMFGLTARHHSARRNGFEICAVFGLFVELARFLPREAGRCTLISADFCAV
jgi:hypothetical protein